jgi:hypothetical protein
MAYDGNKTRKIAALDGLSDNCLQAVLLDQRSFLQIPGEYYP